MPATAPSRTTTTMTLSWGLLSIPLSVYSGTEDWGIKRHRYTADGHPVGNKNFDKVTGDDVEFSEIVANYECPDGKIVPLSDDEIEAVIQPNKGVADIVAFIPLSHLVAGTYLPKDIMQVRPAPDRSGKTKRDNPATTKAFVLLMDSMREEGVFALVHYASRGKPTYAAILPDGRLFTLYYDEAVRADREFPQVEVSDAERAVGRQLVSALLEAQPPVLSDEATKRVHEYALAKAAGGKTVQPVDVPVQVPGDLMAVLTASLAATPKPKAKKSSKVA